MSEFDITLWKKNQYLAEAGLGSSQAQSLAKLIGDAINQVDDSLSYRDLAVAVSIILKEDYGTHNFNPFMEVLHAELGIEESLNEGDAKDIKKVDIAFVDGTSKLYGVYVYRTDEKNVQWDEKLRSEGEFSDFLKSLGIDIEYNINNLDKVEAALKSKGIKVEQSEFDVS